MLNESNVDNLGLTPKDVELVKEYEAWVRKRPVRPGEQVQLQALLWWAIDHGTVSQLESVLAAGANPNMVFPRGSTPLGRAFYAFRGADQLKAVRLLLEAGADPRVTSDNKPPLVIASREGPDEAFDLVLAFLKKTGNISPSDVNPALLYTAACRPASAMVELLNCGAAVNHLLDFTAAALPNVPLSALMIAATHGRPEVVKILLEAGADVNLQDAEGHTAMDYALFDPKPSRKVIALLEKAGAITARPFPRPWETMRGFAKAAKAPAFKAAVSRIKQLTGLRPSGLEGVEGKIPGGYGFLLDENSSRTFVEGGVEGYLGVQDRARHFVDLHHAETLAQGAYLFHTRDLTERNGTALALLPTTDAYRVIAAVQTEGPNSNFYNDALIAWLRSLEKDQPFLITGVGTDFIEGKFLTPIPDPAALAKRINAICPPEDETPGAEQKQVENLRQTNKLFLWWD